MKYQLNQQEITIDKIFVDDYSRFNINEDNNNRKYSYPSTHETKQQIPTSYSSDHSRESSPTTGYISPTKIRTTTSNTYQTGTPSSSTYIPQYNYRIVSRVFFCF